MTLRARLADAGVGAVVTQFEDWTGISEAFAVSKDGSALRFNLVVIDDVQWSDPDGPIPPR